MGNFTEKIQLTLEERELLLKYGYPCDRLEKALRRWSRSEVIRRIGISAYELESLIGELSRSFNQGELGDDERDVLELCERMEYVEKYGDGDLDILY